MTIRGRVPKLWKVNRWAIVGFGVLLFAAAGSQLLVTDDRILIDVVEVGVPLGIALGLIVGGFWLRATHPDRRIVSIAPWVAGGAVVGIAINLWFVFIISLEYTPTGDPVVLNLNAAAGMMATGAALGYYATGLHERERDLKRSESRFRALTENAPFAVVTIDETSTVRYANDAVEDLFGYDPDEVVGTSLATLMPERLRDRHFAAVDRYLETGDRSFDWGWVELLGRHKDGHELPLGITFGEYHHADRPLFTGILRDITEQVERREQVERQATAMEAAMDGMAILDAADEYVYVNQAYADIYDYDSPAELIGDPWHYQYDEDETRRFETKVVPAVRKEGHWRGEAVGTRTNGSTFPQEVSLTALDDGGLVCVVRDITERKQRERAVQALHEATREMVQATDRQQVAERAVETVKEVLDMPVNGLWVHEPDHDRLRPVAWTSEATALLGELPTFAADEPSLAWKVFETGEAKLIADLDEHPQRYNPDTPLRSEIIIPIGDDAVMHIGATEPDAFDASDVALARLLAANTGVALDRIDRMETLRERTEQLERQNEHLDEFASVVSHDLRNPLNTAQGYVDLARTECDSDHLDAAERALTRMEALIADTLTLARDGQTVEETDPVALERVIDRAWATVAPYGDLQIELDDVTVMADPDRLQRVVENLFRNAAEHAGPDVTVRVGVVEDGRGFYVADDGPGIPEAERDAVFDHGHTTSDEGTGFGLSIVRSIVEAHGWAIAVTESAAGGARFEITGVEQL